jgi:hypothetical protein
MYALLYISNNRLSSVTAQMPNPRFEGTTGKRCLPVTRGLRPRVAPLAIDPARFKHEYRSPCRSLA